MFWGESLYHIQCAKEEYLYLILRVNVKIPNDASTLLESIAIFTTQMFSMERKWVSDL